jgi:tRNA(Ile)-lysidine synthase
MLKKVIKHLDEHRLIKSGDRIIAAVSGGPDSMALLHILKNLSSARGFELVAAHLNHGLREEADAEAEFVGRYCIQWGIPYYCRKVDVAALSKMEKKSLEDAGRTARYQYFNELADKLNADRIATAHHGDDVAETVLMHLLRGSGIKGLRGILPANQRIIRPLLPVNKTEILAYLQEQHIEYCLDSSNDDPAYLRNRIRRQLLPYLQENYNPRIVESLQQLALLMKDENEALEEESARLWDKIIVEQKPDLIAIDSQIFFGLPLAYQRRLILRILAELAGEGGWELEDVQKIIRAREKTGSSRILQLKKNIRVIKTYDKMVFNTNLTKISPFCYRVLVPGEINIVETGERYGFMTVKKDDYTPRRGETYLDYDRLPPDLYIRSRREGDVFRPSGLNGSQKIKDFFINLKIPYMERDKIPLLASAGNQIFAVVGWRISAECAVGQETRTLLLVKKIYGR